MKKIFNREEYLQRENDKERILKLLNTFDKKLSKNLEEKFEFKIYGLGNYMEYQSKNYLSDFSLKRLKQFRDNLKSCNIDLSLYKTVKEMSNQFYYDDLVLYTEFLIESTNLEIEISQILESYNQN